MGMSGRAQGLTAVIFSKIAIELRKPDELETLVRQYIPLEAFQVSHRTPIWGTSTVTAEFPKVKDAC